ncbi:hypothetical protein [Variovorax sp. dw_954]|uniref:hypothetical protein n=1 Tax=Variovorax sp. dw_954 TaxID=2720078 RepID=UPI001BD3A64D|nr:hypothetical protein [Variovorax sp. dw_954]
MSRVTVTIDRIVVSGLEPTQRDALVAALESELVRVLAGPGDRAAVSRRTPVLRLGRVPLGSGTSGARAVGQGIAHAIGTAAGAPSGKARR